jgi:hypothetical protein
MVKRLKVSLYAAALAGFSMLAMGCDGFSLYNSDVSSWPRIIAAILREDLFS